MVKAKIPQPQFQNISYEKPVRKLLRAGFLLSKISNYKSDLRFYLEERITSILYSQEQFF